jgi:hypothetical protein
MSAINLPNLKDGDNVEIWAKNFRKAVENNLEELLYGRRRLRNIYEIGNKELDDTDIGDQKVLLYDATGDVIKYASQNDMRVGYADNTANADYATNAGHATSADSATNAGYATNANYADNADMVDNEHANAFEHVAKKGESYGYAGLNNSCRLTSRQRLPYDNIEISNDGVKRSITGTSMVWQNNMKVVLSTLAYDLIIVFLTGFFWTTNTRLRVQTWPYSGTVSSFFCTDIGAQLDVGFVKYNQISVFHSHYNQLLDIRQRWRLEGAGTGYCVERSMVAFTVGQV